MSNAAYDRLWREAMKDLSELLAIEDPTVTHAAEPDAKPLPVVEMSPGDAFEHFRSMYLRYLCVYHKLERCYEGMLHPQKRLDVVQVLEAVITRLVQLRHALVKWHPLNPEVLSVSPGKPLPWEDLNYEDRLLALKIQPETLDITPPAHYRDINARDARDRDRVVADIMQRVLGVDRVLAELDEVGDGTVGGIAFSVEEAVAVIQRNERGRQGKQRAAVWKERRAEEAKAAAAASSGGLGRTRRGVVAESDAEESSDEELDPHDAAAEIQRIARGFLARKQVNRARMAELVFVGMKDAPRPRLAALEAAMAETAKLRKIDQAANKEAYEAALESISKMVLEDDGAEMRDRMKAARTTWFTSQLAAGVIPEDLSGYYAMLMAAATGEAKPAEVEDPKAKGKGKGDKAKPAPKKDDKKGKAKGKGVEEEDPDKPPPVTGASEWTKTTESLLRAYDATWVGRDEKTNTTQRHDVDLAREIVRPTVEEKVRGDVDAEMASNFKNFLLLKKGAADKKKDKKTKGKKGGKDKKKGKKEKPLPGAKACAGLEMKDYISLLVENRIINNPRTTATFASFMGGINLLGSKYATTDSPSQRHPGFGFWMPADPSMAQVREALMHYAVLPIGSLTVRTAVAKYCADHKLCGGKVPRTVLLYGPRGCGKTHLAQAVANALGALFLNLSAGNVDGKFAEKGGAAKLLHMAFEIAKDPALGPVVIYIDEVEKMIAAGGKKKATSSEGGPTRFKKDLATYIKSLNDSHSAVVIGASSEPWEADMKAMNECFEKKLYIPCPDYATRLKLWRFAIGAALAAVPDPEGYSGITTSALSTIPGSLRGSGGSDTINTWGGALPAGPSAGHDGLNSLLQSLPMATSSIAGGLDSTSALLDRLNISSLASVSNGYTCGSIRRAVRETLTPRRLERLAHRPLVESEFIAVLARCPRVYADENDKFREFTDNVTTLTERRKPAEDDGKGKDKKAKKK